MGTRTLEAGAMAIKNQPMPKETQGLVFQYLNALNSISRNHKAAGNDIPFQQRLGPGQSHVLRAIGREKKKSGILHHGFKEGHKPDAGVGCKSIACIIKIKAVGKIKHCGAQDDIDNRQDA